MIPIAVICLRERRNRPEPSEARLYFLYYISPIGLGVLMSLIQGNAFHFYGLFVLSFILLLRVVNRIVSDSAIRLKAEDPRWKSITSLSKRIIMGLKSSRSNTQDAASEFVQYCKRLALLVLLAVSGIFLVIPATFMPYGLALTATVPVIILISLWVYCVHDNRRQTLPPNSDILAHEAYNHWFKVKKKFKAIRRSKLIHWHGTWIFFLTSFYVACNWFPYMTFFDSPNIFYNDAAKAYAYADTSWEGNASEAREQIAHRRALWVKILWKSRNFDVFPQIWFLSAIVIPLFIAPLFNVWDGLPRAICARALVSFQHKGAIDRMPSWADTKKRVKHSDNNKE